MQKCILICVVVGLSSLFPAASYATSLNEVVAKMLETNPDVLTTTNERLAREQELKQARGPLYPTLDLIAGVGRERRDTPSTRARGEGSVTLTRRAAELRLQQLIFDGFARESEIDRQKARVDSAAYTVYGTSEIISLRAIEVYLDVLRRQLIVDLAKENLEDHKIIYDQVKARSRAGVGRKSDLDQIEGRLARAEANLVAARADLQDAQTNYFSVVNTFPDNLERPILGAEALPASMVEAVDLGVARNPVLRSANADVAAAEAEHRGSKNPYYPRLDFVISGITGEDIDGLRGDHDEALALLRLRYNLFRGGANRARVRETAFLLSEAAEVRNRTYRQVVESIRLSWVAYEAQLRRLTLFEQQVISTERTRDAYKKQFDIGQRTLLDLLDTENEFTDAKLSRINSDYDNLFAKYRILTGMGVLLETMGIQPPAEALATQN